MKQYLLTTFFFLLTACTTNSANILYHHQPAFYSYLIGKPYSSRSQTEYAADVYVTPASCQKIITTLTALKTLGADYRYTTKLYVNYDSKRYQNIILSMSGDPSLTSADLIALLKPLTSQKISGELIIDASLWKVPSHSPNIMLADLGSDYAQPVSPLNLDANLIKVSIYQSPSNKSISLKNELHYSMKNQLIATQEESAVNLIWEGETLQAKGQINWNDLPMEIYVSPPNIDNYFIRKLRIILKKLNIKLRFRIIHHDLKIRKHSRLLKPHVSSSLGEIISPALKKSDNLIFDSLYLTMIQNQQSTPILSWDEGSDIMKKLIWEHFKIDMQEATLVDGSGLSRYNRIKTRSLFKLLQQNYLNSLFQQALPSPGEINTTLANRFLLLPGLRAKTGTLAGISCLAGYHFKRKQPKVFVFTANGFGIPNAEFLSIMDNFLYQKLQ